MRNIAYSTEQLWNISCIGLKTVIRELPPASSGSALAARVCKKHSQLMIQKLLMLLDHQKVVLQPFPWLQPLTAVAFLEEDLVKSHPSHWLKYHIWTLRLVSRLVFAPLIYKKHTNVGETPYRNQSIIAPLLHIIDWTIQCSHYSMYSYTET